MEKDVYANLNEKKAGIFILTSGRVDFKTRKIIRDNYITECHVIIKRSDLQEDSL